MDFDGITTKRSKFCCLEGVIQQSDLVELKVKILAQKALPVPFIDSFTAALELAQQGLDFIYSLREIMFTGKFIAQR